MRDWQETMGWYASHDDAREIGFNPDGMCLKVCRTGRAIGSRYSTAKIAQDNTPKQYRVYKVRDLRRGMVLYFDDPNDSNKAGHIVTMIGRVRGGDPDSLHDVLVKTNSVVKGKLVTVRADYFKEHWGDDFQFGATWLNGQELDIPSGNTRVKQFKAGGPQWDVKLLRDAVANGRHDVEPQLKQIEALVKDLPDDKGNNSRVDRFTDYYRRTGILHMGLLNNAVNLGDRRGSVMRVRDQLREVIKSLPER